MSVDYGTTRTTMRDSLFDLDRPEQKGMTDLDTFTLFDWIVDLFTRIIEVIR